jgi:vesicle-fusing ATPase
VNGPEILNKFVGASEENIRNLFKEAEEDTIANGDNAELHIIIFDEIDAICKSRGRGGDSTGVHDTVVNQLLSKIDGVNALNNILVIGMTNRKDMIDSALLRPGRLEVHIEIGLPDEKGRVQIFNIHLKPMRENKMLHEEVTSEYLASQTKNFSGAEIEGLVKSASSFALYSSIDIKKNGAKPVDVSGKNIIVRLAHFQKALDEVKAAFGVDEDELKMYLRTDLLDYGSEYQKIIATCKTLINQVRTSKATPLLSVLLEGPNGSGKVSETAHAK